MVSGPVAVTGRPDRSRSCCERSMRQNVVRPRIHPHQGGGTASQAALGLVGLMLMFLLAVSVPVRALADEPKQAGMVVQFGDGHVETRCITLEGDEISGDELLARSGLQVIVDASTGMGITVCQIEGVGCAYPTEHCFCQCMGGGECAYWTYFYRDPGEAEWTYSPLGAVLRKVGPGSVESWVWGDGQALPDEALTFEAICKPPTPTPTLQARSEDPTMTPELPTPVPEVATPAPTSPQVPTELPEPTSTVVPLEVSPSPAPAAGTGQSLASYWPFGLMVVGLLLAGVLVWRRRA